MEPIFFCVHFSTGTSQKLLIFFTYIRPKESRSIRYNSMYFILACIDNFAATVTLNILRLFTSQLMKVMITG